MYYKISPVLIIVISLVIIAVIMFGAKIFIDNKKVNEPDKDVSEIIPVLELSVNSEEPEQENVIITAKATTDDESGIYGITLPDGSLMRSSRVTYKANQNGNYTFKVKGNNGQTNSLTIEVTNIREVSAEHPYIPTGFSHIEGDVKSGYIIQDSYGNEFVWVPVYSGKLTRNTMLDDNYEESNNTATALVNSVAQNYGFYIGRYEASKYEINGSTVAASIGNRMPWNNVTYIEAAEVAQKSSLVFGYEEYKTAIINSFAWDTTLAWIDESHENYSSNTSHGNYSGTIRNTGATESDIKNNICDMAGNVREWTTEIYKYKEPQKTNSRKRNSSAEEILSETVTYRVIRGGSAATSRTANSHTGYKESMSDAYWGFRMILYK